MSPLLSFAMLAHRSKLRCLLSSYLVGALTILLLSLPEPGLGHGRLLEPPSRSSMWRFGFGTTPNYNDNELFCGGYTVHFKRNAGQCGICGDAFNLPQPRPNEAGGKYGQGIIVKRYTSGETIQVIVELTANHLGFFEFKLCPNNNIHKIATQECLDQYPLVVAGTNDETKYYLPRSNSGKFDVNLKLPEGLSCSQCVFQWSYTAGNNWGTCEDGTGKLGCGPQETFRGCADVSVGDTNSVSKNVNIPFPSTMSKPKASTPRPNSKTTRPKPTSTTKPISFTTRPRPTTSKKPTTTKATFVARPRPTRPPTTTSSTTVVSINSTKIHRINAKPRPQFYKPKPSYVPEYSKPSKTNGVYDSNEDQNQIEQTKDRNVKKCRGVGLWKRLPGIAGWCDINCVRGYCPPTHCHCS